MPQKSVPNDMNQALSAGYLVTAAIGHATIVKLTERKIITPDEAIEIYEQALLMIETQQAKSLARSTFELARELIEQHLRPKSPGGKNEKKPDPTEAEPGPNPSVMRN